MKIANELLPVLVTLILVLFLGFSFLLFLLNTRIGFLKELIKSYIDSIHLKEYFNAKEFITYHESLPGLSEYEQKRLEGARQIVKAYEGYYNAPKEN